MVQTRRSPQGYHQSALKLIGDIRVASTLGFENIPELGHLQQALRGQ